MVERSMLSRYRASLWGAVGLVFLEGLVSSYLLPRGVYESILGFLTGDYPAQVAWFRQEIPVTEALHRVLGVLLLATGLLQFDPDLRRHRPRLHRGLGYVFAGCAVVTSVTAIVIAVLQPFGGATEQGLLIPGALAFLFLVAKAIAAARSRRVAEHREWMIPTLGFAFFIVAQRAYFPLLRWFTDWSDADAFVVSSVLGVATTMVCAECWINRTRPSALGTARAVGVSS